MSDIAQRVEFWLEDSGDGRIAPENTSALAAAESIETAMLSLVPVARTRARPVISGFKVGAIGEGVSGALYLGANFEFRDCTLGHSIHAEQAVVANASAHGETGLIRIAVSAPPCGHCRQFLYELGTAEQLDVIQPDKPPAKIATLLPGAFGPGDLGLSGGLLDASDARDRVIETDSSDSLEQAAVASARASYAPYSRAWGGAAIQMSAGRIFAGAYLENAAFNPSLPPVQVAYVLAALAGYAETAFARAVIAQSEASLIDHHAEGSLLLGKIAPQASVQLFEFKPNKM